MKYAIVIPPGLAAKLERQHIAEADVGEVVAHLESTGNKLLDRGTGLYTGHHRLDNLTCWVAYRLEDGVVTVDNAYVHRMRIAGEENETGGIPGGETDC